MFVCVLDGGIQDDRRKRRDYSALFLLRLEFVCTSPSCIFVLLCPMPNALEAVDGCWIIVWCVIKGISPILVQLDNISAVFAVFFSWPSWWTWPWLAVTVVAVAFCGVCANVAIFVLENSLRWVSGGPTWWWSSWAFWLHSVSVTMTTYTCSISYCFLIVRRPARASRDLSTLPKAPFSQSQSSEFRTLSCPMILTLTLTW